MTVFINAALLRDLLFVVLFVVLVGAIAALGFTMYLVGRRDEKYAHETKAARPKE